MQGLWGEAGWYGNLKSSNFRQDLEVASLLECSMALPEVLGGGEGYDSLGFQVFSMIILCVSVCRLIRERIHN